MAIQNRRGNYEDFVPSKMLPGEFAVVQNGDPNSTDGKAVYMAFQTGDVKRLATYNELQTEVSNAAEEIAQDITDDFEQQITPLVNSASQSASNASASATQAQNIVNSAVADIQAAGTTQVAAVQAKGDEVLDSIPADYTDLSDDVSALKADLDNYATTYGLSLISGRCIGGDGNEYAGVGRYVSEYIPCPPNVAVTYVGENNHANIFGLAFYDRNLVFIGGDKNNGQPKGTPTTVTSPDNTCYCRISTDEALVTAGNYYVGVDSQNKSFVWTNERINAIEKTLEAERKISLAQTPFVYPSEFDMTPKVTVYTDGHHYSTDFNAKDYINSGGRTLYVAPLATSSGNGTRENPYRYANAYNAAQDGDTIVLMGGIYTRAGQYFTEIKKSINVVGEDGAVICLGDLTAFTLASGYQDVYVGQRSGGTYVFDISEAPNRVVPLKSVGSIADCAATVGSYFKDSSYYYVHPFVEGNPTGKLLVSVLNTVEIPLSVSNADQSVNVYIGNITLIANSNGTRVNMVNSENTLTVCYDNVKFAYCGYGQSNTFTAYGGNIIFHKCEIDGSYRDGYNYNGSTVGGVEPRICNAIEIDCKASNCGIGQTQETMNASTSHLGTKIVRINGEYHDTLGPVVADTQSGTQSVNLGCKSYSSTAKVTQIQNSGYQAANSGSQMWLYDCVAAGNKYDFAINDGGAMTLYNCAYDTISEGIESENNENVATWLLRNVI